MRRKIIFSMIFSMIFMFLTAQYLFAHQAWVEKKGKKIVVLYGHGDRHDPYDPAKIKEVKGFDIKGKSVPVKIVREKDSVSLSPKGKVAVITATFDGGFSVKTTEGTKKGVSKRDVKEYISATQSVKYCKTFLGPSDVFAEPVGLKLEIIPLKDPLSLKLGDELEMKVLYEGKPVEGVKIGIAGYTTDKVTDKEGLAKIKINNKGMQVIAAGHKIPLRDNPDVDVLSISTSITFEVK